MDDSRSTEPSATRAVQGFDQLYEDLVYSVAEQIELEHRKLMANQAEQTRLYPPT
jgi:hypothetical protein